LFESLLGDDILFVVEDALDPLAGVNNLIRKSVVSLAFNFGQGCAMLGFTVLSTTLGQIFRGVVL